MAVAGDVRDEKTCQSAVGEVVKRFGRLDTLINNAAGNFLASLDDLTPKGFKTVIEIDLIGVFNMSHAAFPHLKASKQGLIINITATLHYGASWYQAHPSAAKAGIDSLTRSFALEWGYHGIRANSIAPGPIEDTAGLTKLAPSTDDEATNKMIAKSIPLRRLGTKFDISMTAIFLASSAGSYVTGDAIVVDGGQWMFRQPPIPKSAVSQMSKAVEAKSRAKI
jgi:2,4-dienoyl-CoA reductase [(3E)-enoyl-CoA-producing], peroxisomal